MKHPVQNLESDSRILKTSPLGTAYIVSNKSKSSLPSLCVSIIMENVSILLQCIEIRGAETEGDNMPIIPLCVLDHIQNISMR